MGLIQKLFKMLPLNTRNVISHKISMSYHQMSTKNLPVKRIFLEQKHVENCRFLSDTIALINELPIGGTVALIGVHREDFINDILTVSIPEAFYLITDNHSKIEYDEKITSFNYTVESLTKLKDQHFDWIYIDSDKSYERLKEELEILAKKIKPGGFICGNKYCMGIWKKWIRFYTIEAVNSFCTEKEFELMYFVQAPNMNYSFALRQIGKNL